MAVIHGFYQSMISPAHRSRLGLNKLGTVMKQTAKSLRDPKADNPPHEGTAPPRLESPLTVQSITLSVVMVLAVIFTLRAAKDVFMPVVISVLVAYALSPVV